ncbi:MAG: hypothetical protein [Bacteriophage sp.]|nr:MAG: hypothetical protein [Bacteriophage sp.]
MANSGIELHIDKFDMYGKLDFDKKQIRVAMRMAGKEVQTAAKRLVSSKQTSKRDQYPGKRSGTLQRSIRSKVSRSGFMVLVKPYKTAAMGKDFYPAYLWYGVRRGAKRGKSHKAGASGGNGWRIAPRKNYMQDALYQKQGRVKAILISRFQKALN